MVSEVAEALAVPGDEGLGPHQGQGVSPIEPAAEQHQRQTRRIVGASGLDLALLLLAQEQSLRCERGLWSPTESEEVDHIAEDPQPALAGAHHEWANRLPC